MTHGSNRHAGKAILFGETAFTLNRLLIKSENKALRFSGGLMLLLLLLSTLSQSELLAAPKPAAKRPATKHVATQPAAKTASGPLERGIASYNKGLVQQAITDFQQAVAQSPNNEQAAVWLARSYMKQGLQEDAKRAYGRVLVINGNNTEALANLGEVYTWDTSTRSEGISMLQRAYKNKDDDAVGRKLAEALLWANRPAEALDVAYPIRGRFGNDKKWLNSYAQILALSGHPDEAVVVYESQLNITESRDLAQLQSYATSLFKAGQRERAEQVYQSIKPYAMELKPEQGIDVKKALAGLAFDLGFYDDVVQLDATLPQTERSKKDTQLRDARALIRGKRSPEAVDILYALYRGGQLDYSEKIEFADFLQSENLTEKTLPESHLVDKLFQQSISENPKNVDAALRMAQRYRFMTPEEAKGIDLFQQTDSAYQQAWQLANQYAPAQSESIKKDYLDFLKTNKTEPANEEYRFKGYLDLYPNDTEIKGAYAEFLSYNEARRMDAMRMYLDLAKSDPENRERWQGELAKVLGWHKPTTDLIPFYQEVVNTFPNELAIWQSVGRAYASNPDYYPEAVEHYTRMLQKFPNEPKIRKDWIDLLMGNPKYRDEAISTLENYTAQEPGDLDAKVALGKLYSYQRHYSRSMDVLDNVLNQDPDFKDAAVAKGYTMMWSGKKLAAKKYLTDMWSKYPDDLDVAIALAQANKFLGRYDEAFEVMRKVRPQLEEATPKRNKSALPTGYVLCANVQPGINFGPVVWDSPVLPTTAMTLPLQLAYAPTPDGAGESLPMMEHAPLTTPAAKPAFNQPARKVAMPATQPTYQAQYEEPSDDFEPETSQFSSQQRVAPVQNKAQSELQSDLDSLDSAIESLNALQESSTRQLNQLQQSIVQSKDKLTAEVSVADKAADDSAVPAIRVQMEEYGLFSSIGYDTNPLLSGLGRFRNNDLMQMERGLQNDLRPTLRAGYSFDTKSGEGSTSRLSSYGFPNQIAISLSPQVRARFGINPYKYYIPGANARSPRSTWSEEYTWGLTAKMTDRLTFDGDMAITKFNQSDSTNITYDASMAYDLTDAWRVRLGSRRVPQFNSLLSVAGLRPNAGAFAGSLVGQSRETGFYGEINWNPNSNWDVNGGYEWAFVDGEHTPTNFKNQAYLSPGFTWYYADNHKVRFGLESLFMSYSKNTLLGYFNTQPGGGSLPVSSLNPVTLAPSGYRFGGYFSPQYFFQNAGRVDLRGSFFDKWLEYKLGGSMGVQTFGNGHSILPHNQTALTASADLNLIANLTDWFALYGFGEYLKAGSVFTRWRFGGGVIVRPKIDFLSPVFHRSAVPALDETNEPVQKSSNASR